MPAWLAACVLAVALLAAGCGDEESETQTSADTLTVYSSFPLSAGDRRREAAALVEGIEVALAEHGGEVDGMRVEHRSLDNSTAEDGGLAPEREAANARMASQDEGAVAYIGGLSFAAAAISIPILNEGGIVAVSPGSGYAGLTRATPVSQPGEPDKYYPTGERNFARIVPADTHEAEVLAGEIEQAGCEAVFVAAEEEVASHALARALIDGLEARGVAIAGQASVDGEAPDLDDLAAEATEARPGCAAVTAATGPVALAAYGAIGEALPRARLFGGGAACRPALEAAGARPPVAVLGRITCTSWVRDRASYRDAGDVELDDPVALYGYEAMRLVLDAIERGGGNRMAVRDALLATADRESALGEYSFDESGDTSLDSYAVYRVRDGRLRQMRLVQPAG